MLSHLAQRLSDQGHHEQAGVVATWGMCHASRRWPGFDTLARRLPYLSSTIIIGIGLYVGALGWMALAPT